MEPRSSCLSVTDLFHLAKVLAIHPCFHIFQNFLLFLRLSGIPLCAYTTFSLPVRPSIDRLFPNMTVVKSAAKNMGVLIAIQDPHFNSFE